MTATAANDDYPLTDDYARDTCAIGQGAACCRYLLMGAKGWECGKHSSLKATIDQRVALGTMNAQSDNCDGFPMRATT